MMTYRNRHQSAAAIFCETICLLDWKREERDWWMILGEVGEGREILLDLYIFIFILTEFGVCALMNEPNTAPKMNDSTHSKLRVCVWVCDVNAVRRTSYNK